MPPYATNTRAREHRFDDVASKYGLRLRLAVAIFRQLVSRPFRATMTSWANSCQNRIYPMPENLQPFEPNFRLGPERDVDMEAPIRFSHLWTRYHFL